MNLCFIAAAHNCAKTMSSYEQTLHLFGRWLSDELKIDTVDKITENVIRNFKESRPKKYTKCQFQHAIALPESGKSCKQSEAMAEISKSTLLRA